MLSRATLANWVIRASEDWLMPVVDRLHMYLLRQSVIHADETPVQVLNEKKRKSTTKSYMWVFSNSEYEPDHQIRIYEYHPGRSGSFAADFLKGFHGILQTDGYSGYEKISCEEHALCWVHGRRYFVEAIPPGLDKNEIADTISGQALKRINELFTLDKDLAELPVADRQQERLRLEKDKLEAFFV